MEVPTIAIAAEWDAIFQQDTKSQFENIVPEFLYSQRWFGSKTRQIGAVGIEDVVRINHNSSTTSLTFLHISYADGVPETYALPITLVTASQAEKIHSINPRAIMARLKAHGHEGFLSTALDDASFCRALLNAIGNHESFEGAIGKVQGVPTPVFHHLVGQNSGSLTPSLMGAEQSNSSIRYGDRVILKLFRRLDEGINPDLEVGAFLTQRGFAHVPPVGGSLEYRGEKGNLITLGILQGFVPNRGDAWRYTLEELSRYYERVAHQGGENASQEFPGTSPQEVIEWSPGSKAKELLGTYLDSIRLLGQRTAELHLALSSDVNDENFAPEPFPPDYDRFLFQSMHNLLVQTFQVLRSQLNVLPEGVRSETVRVLGMEPQALQRFRMLLDRKITAMLTRVHGDYHLGQVLFTGNDFVIIDFEGEPARPIRARRIKRSPLRDIAGMLRSFHYAAYSALIERMPAAGEEPDGLSALEPWTQRWYAAVSATFLQSYLRVAGHAPFLPRSQDDQMVLLDAYILEKAIYEVAYELNSRPNWLRIPLKGIEQLLQGSL